MIASEEVEDSCGDSAGGSDASSDDAGVAGGGSAPSSEAGGQTHCMTRKTLRGMRKALLGIKDGLGSIGGGTISGWIDHVNI